MFLYIYLKFVGLILVSQERDHIPYSWDSTRKRRPYIYILVVLIWIFISFQSCFVFLTFYHGFQIRKDPQYRSISFWDIHSHTIERILPITLPLYLYILQILSCNKHAWTKVPSVSEENWDTRIWFDVKRDYTQSY